MSHSTLVGTLTDLVGPVDAASLLRLLLAAFLGGMVGWEREHHGRAAGLRTHLLLCVGCALMMLVSLYVPTRFATLTADSVVRADPGRLAAQVVSGLGFLGAGAIIVLGRHIRGLTTAASIWVTAAIGLAVGAGCIVPAVFCWLLVMFALHALVALERSMANKDHYVEVRLTFSAAGILAPGIREMLGEYGFEVQRMTLDRDGPHAVYQAQLHFTRAVDFERAANGLMEQMSAQGLTALAWD